MKNAFRTSVYTLATCLATVTYAQFPTAKLESIFPPGGERGTTVVTTLSGSNLDDATSINFSHPGISAKPVMSTPSEFDPTPQPLSGKMLVTIAPDVPCGIYDATVNCRFGVSTPRCFVVGAFPEVIKTTPTDSRDNPLKISYPASISGQAVANTTDFFSISCVAGARLHIEVWAHRIDSKLRPVMTILDPHGARVPVTTHRRSNDRAVTFIARTAGTYVIEIHDRFAEGGKNFFYRLDISDGVFVTSMFPRAINASKPSTLIVQGHGLEDRASDSPAPDVLDHKKTIDLGTADISFSEHARPTWRILSPRESTTTILNLRGGLFDSLKDTPAVTKVGLPVIPEIEPNDDGDHAHRLTLPTVVAGHFFPRHDRDWFSFEAKQGDEFVFDVLSRRLGMSSDTSILIESITVDANEESLVKEVAFVDDGPKEFSGPTVDRPTLDSTLPFKAPHDGTYRVCVREQSVNSVADPSASYVLDIRPPAPDFQVLALTIWRDQADAKKIRASSTSLPIGGTISIDLLAIRQDGYEGEITVTAEDLPHGVTAEPVVIARGKRRGVLVLQATDQATVTHKQIRLIGRGLVGDEERTHEARSATLQWDVENNNQPHVLRCTDSIYIAVTADHAPISLSIKESQIWETARGGKLTVPIDVVHRIGSKGTLSLKPLDYPAEFKLPKDLKISEIKLPETEPSETQDDQKIASTFSTSEINITVGENTKPGTYTVALGGLSKCSYSRNQDAVEKSKADVARVTQIIERRAAKLTEAQASLADLDTQLKAIQEKGNVSSDDIATRRTEKQADVNTLTTDLRRAEDEKKVREQQLTSITKANAAKDITIPTVLTPFTLVVHDSPVSLSIQPESLALPSSGSESCTVVLDRRFGCDEPLRLEVQTKETVAGLTIPPVIIPAKATQGTLTVQSDAGTPVGNYTINLKGTVKFFERSVSLEQSIPLTITGQTQEIAN